MLGIHTGCDDESRLPMEEGMNTVRKTTAVIAAAVLTMGVLSGCGGTGASSSSQGRVYYMNQKGENNEQFVQLGKLFTKDTGIPFDITTASPGNYEQTLKSELAKTNAPTLIGLDNNDFPNWVDYCDDLSGTRMYKDLQNRDYVLKDGDTVKAIPFVLDRYGIIYNRAILKEYFAADWASIHSEQEVRGFDALKKMVEEIQAHKSDLGIKGAFTSAGFEASSRPRYGDMLPHIPVFYEYRDQNTTVIPSKVSGKYVPNLKKIFDLMIKNETVAPTQLSGATLDDAISEFALGDAAFIEMGSWAYPQLRGKKVSDKDMGVFPLYMGIPGEENSGLTISSNYFAINSKASQKDKDATKKFLDWMLDNDGARKIVTDTMGFETPFKSYAKAGFKTKNPILRANDVYAKRNCYDLVIRPLPTAQWALTMADAMLEYAQGTGPWSKVESSFVDGWTSEYNTVHKS